MLPYEFYKVLHLAMIFLLVTGLSLSFLGGQKPTKGIKILTGVTSFFILVGGMGLLARIGVSHTEGWPVWAYIKVVIWMIVAIGAPIMSKRLERGRAIALYSLITLMIVAAYSAVYKPFEV